LSQALGFLPKGKLNQRVDSIKSAFWGKDTSAFAVVYPELGVSFDGEGGLAITIYSERQITSPILAKFAQYQPAGEFYRGWYHAAKSALSPCYIGPRLSEMGSMAETRNKISPILQFYNFDEFFTVLSLTLGNAIYEACQNTTTIGITTCPLTSQAVQILLRQAMIAQFSNYMAQDISLGDVFYPMRPFVVGPNGLGINQSSMLIPTFLAENIRCSVPRQISLSDKNGVACLDFLAVLARPADQPQLGNYATGVFSGPPTVYTDPVGEALVNIIDMSTLVSSNPVYLSASGDSLDAQLSKWNNWIQTLSGNLSPLVTIGSEAGVSALMTVMYTNTQQDVTIEVAGPRGVPLQKKPSLKHLGTPPCKAHVGVAATPITPGYLDSFTEKEIICNNVVSTSINRYIASWVLPSALSTGETSQASLQTWQTFQIQPYLIPRAQAGGVGGDFPAIFPTIGSRLLRMASYDVKGSNAQQPNEFIAEIAALGKQGRGGFFSAIAGELSGMLIPGSSKYVESALGNLGL